jgi:predicted phosphoribosyltransferase
VAREQRELDLKERRYRRRRAPPQVKAKRVILVDDGAATGATMIAAVAAARRWGAGEVVVALPVAAREAIRELGEIADRVVCPLVPEPFHAVGAWYARFEQLDDATVRQILQLGSRDQPARPDRPQRASQQTT